MFILGLVLVCVLITYLEVPGLIRKKMWGELAAFSGLMAIGFILALLQIEGVKVPSPAKGIIYIFTFLFSGSAD